MQELSLVVVKLIQTRYNVSKEVRENSREISVESISSVLLNLCPSILGTKQDGWNGKSGEEYGFLGGIFVYDKNAFYLSWKYLENSLKTSKMNGSMDQLGACHTSSIPFFKEP